MLEDVQLWVHKWLNFMFTSMILKWSISLHNLTTLLYTFGNILSLTLLFSTIYGILGGHFTFKEKTLGGGVNSTVVSVSVCPAGRPSSRPARSACFREVGCYENVIDLFPPVLTTGSTKTVHVLLCLCNNACERSLPIVRKSRASRPVSRLLPVPIWPARVEQGR